MALIFVQVYWITNAMGVRQENFVRSVNEAVDGVVLRLEKSNRTRIPENIQMIENRLTYNLIDSLLKDELHKNSICW